MTNYVQPYPSASSNGAVAHKTKADILPATRDYVQQQLRKYSSVTHIRQFKSQHQKDAI
ncbi:hypothetical protein FBU31_004574, partial [Coemansia sp. 'formosensis']